MTRKGQDAIDFAYESVGNNVMPDSGLCLVYVRTCHDVAAVYPSAIDAWNNAKYPHPDDRNPPPAVPCYFWSSSPYRHVAFHLGDNQYTTTYNDDVRIYGMSAMEDIYGPFLGWAEDVNGVYVYEHPDPGPDPEPEPEPEPERDDRMSYTATGPDGQLWLFSGVEKRPITQEGANALSVLGKPGTVPYLGSIGQTALDTYLDVGGGPYVPSPEPVATSYTATGPTGQLWLVSGTVRRPISQDQANALSVLAEPATTPYLGGIDQVALDAYMDIGGQPTPGATRWSPRAVVLLVLALAFLALIVLAPFALDVPETAKPYLALVGALGGALVTLAATSSGEDT